MRNSLPQRCLVCTFVDGCAASLAIIERHWKKKKLDLEARKRGYLALVNDATALEARVAKANKALKARLRELQQVFTVGTSVQKAIASC